MGLKSVSELRAEFDKLVESENSIKSMKADVLNELAEATEAELAALFVAKSKASGDVSTVIDGVKVKREITKEIVWDNALLQEAAKLLPADKVALIIAAKLSIPEKMYSTLSVLLPTDSPAIAAINKARTVKYGVPKVTFVKDE